MQKQMNGFRSWGPLLLVLALSSPLWAQEQPASNMDILRDKIKADKKLLIAENLSLTESEATKFWPVYEEYQKELEAINQKLTKTIESYAAEYNAATLTDEKAKTLMTDALAVEEAELALKRKYLEKLSGIIPAMKRCATSRWRIRFELSSGSISQRTFRSWSSDWLSEHLGGVLVRVIRFPVVLGSAASAAQLFRAGPSCAGLCGLVRDFAEEVRVMFSRVFFLSLETVMNHGAQDVSVAANILSRVLWSCQNPPQSSPLPVQPVFLRTGSFFSSITSRRASLTASWLLANTSATSGSSRTRFVPSL